MDIEIYDDGEDPKPPLFGHLLAMEEALKPSRWERLLMWLGLKKDGRFTNRPWFWSRKTGKIEL